MVPIAVLLLVIELAVVPTTTATAEKKLNDAFRAAAVWGLQAGQFHVLQGGDFVIYIEALEDDGRALRKVFIHQRDEENEKIWFADRGEFWLDPESGERFITLQDGQITESTAGQLDVRLLNFKRNDLRMPEADVRTGSVELASRPSTDLIAEGSAASWAELQWRVTPSLLILVLTFLAIPLSHSDPREGRGGRVVLGILVYALYSNTLYLCRSWVSEGILPVWLGLWWAHGIVITCGLIWLYRQGRMPRSRPA